jgi:UDP-N-acetylmuramyl pentapeptide phosphotransferase/UDP-N-acetylglucosamine-1-phosphate transferase
VNNETVLAWLFLVVSVVSTVVQGTAFVKILRWRYKGTDKKARVHFAMVRTAGCRVMAAAIYIAVGITTLLAQQALPVLALVVFSFVQILWQANSFADVRLRRDLEGKGE